MLRLTVADDGLMKTVSTAGETETPTYRFRQLALWGTGLTVGAVNAWGPSRGDPASVSFGLPHRQRIAVEATPGYFR